MFVSLDPFRSVQVTMGLLWDQFRSIDKRQISKTTSAHSVEMSSCSRVGRGRSTESDTTSLLFRDGRLMRSRLLESCSSSIPAPPADEGMLLGAQDLAMPTRCISPASVRYSKCTPRTRPVSQTPRCCLPKHSAFSYIFLLMFRTPAEAVPNCSCGASAGITKPPDRKLQENGQQPPDWEMIPRACH